MGNFVRRWTITDPFATDPTSTVYGTWTFPRNPREMTSLHAERAVSANATTNGKALLFEGATPPKSWTFSGPLFHKTELDALNYWVYHVDRRVIINDHFGRNITCVLTILDAVPTRATGFYWSHEYTITGLVLHVTAPTILDGGPLP